MFKHLREVNMTYFDHMKFSLFLSFTFLKATFDALLRLRNANTVAEERGISLEKVFNG